jgi:hypothetical protein
VGYQPARCPSLQPGRAAQSLKKPAIGEASLQPHKITKQHMKSSTTIENEQPEGRK